MTGGVFNWSLFGRARYDTAPDQTTTATYVQNYIVPGGITYASQVFFDPFGDESRAADAASEARGKELLLALLTDSEHAVFLAKNRIEITSATGHCYCYDGISFFELNRAQRWMQSACINVDYRAECYRNIFDRMVTFLLWIRGNEQELRRKANWGGIYKYTREAAARYGY